MAVIGDYVTVENDTIKYPSVFSLNDYYVFGAKKELGNSSTYRYGFNGKENDDEVKGEGNQQDYGMRIYDPRLGKFLSVDPLTGNFAMLTPYQYASNSPISYIDIDGLEGIWYIKAKVGVYGESTAKIIKGTEDGIEKVVQSTWKFFSEDAWKKETWIKAADGLGTIADMTFGNLDGRNDQVAYSVIQPKVDNFKNEVIEGDAYTRSRYFSELGTAALVGGITDKGLSKIGALGRSAVSRVSGKYMSGSFIIGKKTFAKVTEHLEMNNFTSDPGNIIMMDRMRKIVNKEMSPTDIDINFARHELREYELMKEGLKYKDAHEAVLKEQNMYHRDYENKLYTKEALKASNEKWFKDSKKY